MEQINSNSRKKKQQLEVFKYFASVLTKEDKPISISNGMLDITHQTPLFYPKCVSLHHDEKTDYF